MKPELTDYIIKLNEYKPLADRVILVLGVVMTTIIVFLLAATFSKHPIHSLIMLILSFFLTAILLVFCGIEYLAALILLIYAGAISILLLFVLMMFDMKELYLLDYFNKVRERTNLRTFLLILILLTMFISGYIALMCYYYPEIVMKLYENDWNYYVDWSSVFQYVSDVKTIGYVLYRFYFFIPILMALMILVTLVCSLALVTSLHKGAKTQISSVQIHTKETLQLK